MELMAKARFVFYLHVAVTLCCAVFAFHAFKFLSVDAGYPTWWEAMFREFAIQFWFCVGLVSTIYFPMALAFLTVRRLPFRWWMPLMIEDVWLSVLQLLSLLHIQPMRS